MILATKFHMPMGDDPNQQGGSRRWIIRAVEDSLRRLDTDWIDLYQVHRRGPTPTSRRRSAALTDLVHQGKVRYIGHSTFPASQIVEAQWVARERGLQRFVTEQPAYSMLVRRIEDDILPTCQRHGMGVLSYSPLTGGWLSGRWRKDAGQQSSSRATRLPERFDLSQPANQRKLDAVEELALLADEAGITLIQLAIAFVLNHPAITSAIIGPRTMEQLEGQLAAADVVLDAGGAGPHRRDRRARHDRQPSRQLLRQPGAAAGESAALDAGARRAAFRSASGYPGGVGCGSRCAWAWPRPRGCARSTPSAHAPRRVPLLTEVRAAMLFPQSALSHRPPDSAPTTTTKEPQGMTITSGDTLVHDLSDQVTGTVLTADQPGYDGARAIHNGLVDRRPALIVRCRTARDVAAAVALARREGLEVCVRGGGHNVAGRAVVDGALMVDLAEMRGSTSTRRRAWPPPRAGRRGPTSTRRRARTAWP